MLARLGLAHRAFSTSCDLIFRPYIYSPEWEDKASIVAGTYVLGRTQDLVAAMQDSVLDSPILLGSLEPVHVLSPRSKGKKHLALWLL